MALCRICFEDASLNDLISPCLCAGTSKYVHRHCLERWRTSSPRAFSQCYECNYSYIIKFQFPMEKFQFNLHQVIDNLGKYMFSLMMILTASLYFRNVGQHLKYPSLTALNFWQHYNKTAYIKVIEDDQINGVCYYFSVTNLIASFFGFGLFICATLYKIRRRLLYWRLCRIPFLFRLFLSYHLIWLYLLMGSYSPVSFDFFVITDSGISIFNLATFISLLNVHDTIIRHMNSKCNSSKVIEPPTGSIV